MPVPKRKTSKSRRDRRASTKFIRPKTIATCSNCSEPILGHHACESCGFYNGKKVMTTKLDRAVKRGEVRREQYEKQAQKEQGHAQESAHDHDENK